MEGKAIVVTFVDQRNEVCGTDWGVLVIELDLDFAHIRDFENNHINLLLGFINYTSRVAKWIYFF